MGTCRKGGREGGKEEVITTLEAVVERVGLLFNSDLPRVPSGMNIDQVG